MKETVWLIVFVFVYINIPLHEGQVKQPVSNLTDQLLKTFTESKAPNKRVQVQQKTWRTWRKTGAPVKNGNAQMSGLREQNVVNNARPVATVTKRVQTDKPTTVDSVNNIKPEATVAKPIRTSRPRKRTQPTMLARLARNRYYHYSYDVISGIKNGSITDPNIIFNSITYETFNWNSQFCQKCLMGDFKVEIKVCYKGQVSISSWHKAFSSWYRKRYRFKRSAKTTTAKDSYDCWWCPKCLK